MADWCEKADGKRDGMYVSRWATGQRSQEGPYVDGWRHGKWTRFYEHGEGVSEDLYGHGARIWQVTSEREAKTRPCP